MLRSLGSRGRILAGLIALLLLAGIAWAFLAQPDSVGESPGVISVTTLHSDVFLKETNAEERPVPGQATTTSGSVIRTSEAGRALIESSSAHRTLVDFSTEIVLNEATSNRTGVALLTGAVWSRLAKVFDSGEYYEIKSGNAVAAVRGTSFGMWYADGVTTLMVTEGSVVFFALDSAGLPIPDTEVLVTAGKKAVCDADGKILVSDMSKEDYALPWIVFNNSNESPGATTPATPSLKEPGSTQEPPSEVPVPSGQSPAPPVSAPGPELSLVSPSRIDEGSKERITIKGSNLEGVTEVRVGSRNVRFEVLSATTATFYADDINPGRHDVTVTGANGSDTLSRALTVVEVVPEDTYQGSYNQGPSQP